MNALDKAYMQLGTIWTKSPNETIRKSGEELLLKVAKSANLSANWVD